MPPGPNARAQGKDSLELAGRCNHSGVQVTSALIEEFREAGIEGLKAKKAGRSARQG